MKRSTSIKKFSDAVLIEEVKRRGLGYKTRSKEDQEAMNLIRATANNIREKAKNQSDKAGD